MPLQAGRTPSCITVTLGTLDVPMDVNNRFVLETVVHNDIRNLFDEGVRTYTSGDVIYRNGHPNEVINSEIGTVTVTGVHQTVKKLFKLSVLHLKGVSFVG